MRHEVIQKALKMLRQEGAHVPRTFVKNLLDREGYEIKRRDIRLFKKHASKLTNGDKLIVKIGRSGVLAFMSYEGYHSRVQTASKARAGKVTHRAA